MRNWSLIILFIWLYVQADLARAQESLVDVVENYNSSLRTNNLSPIITLNKSLYFAGEVVFTSAFLSGNVNYPVNASTYVFKVELHDYLGKKIVSELVRCSRGKLLGQFTIPDWAQSGSYELKINDTSGSELAKTYISVISANDTQQANSNHGIQFFADGDKLLAGINNKLNYRRDITEKIGGWIISANNDTLKNVKLSSDIGSFEVEGMQANTSHFFVDNWNNRTLLPNVVERGAKISITKFSKHNLELRVHFVAVSSSYYLIGYGSKEVFFSREISPDSSSLNSAIDIELNSPPEGLIRLELIDGNGKIISSQKIINPFEPGIEIQLTSDSFTKQTAINARIRIKSADDAIENISVVVRKSLGYPLDPALPLNLLSASLLNKWTIHGNSDEISVEDEKLITDLTAIQYQREPSVNRKMQGLELSQNVFIKMEDVKLSSANPEDVDRIDNVALYVLESRDVIIAGKREGGFLIPLHKRFSTQNIYGDKSLAAFAYDEKREFLGQVSFSVNQNAAIATVVPADGESIVKHPAEIQKLINRYNQQRLIAQSYRKAAENNWTNYDYIKNASRDVSQTIVPSEFDTFITMEELVKNIVPYVRVKGPENNLVLKVIEKDTWEGYITSPMILIDGIPTFDNSTFFALSPSVIDYVEIINEPDLCRDYDLLGQGGVVAVHLKPGEINPLSETGLPMVNITGLNDPTELENLRFNVGKQEGKYPDFKELLFWQPFLRLKEIKETGILFYSSDETGLFEIEVKGITSNGNTVVGIAYFMVESESR